MKKKIGIAGNIILDVVKRIDAWPQRGMLVNISRLSRSVGGCVCNTATDIKKLDGELRVSVYGKTGEDEYGDWVIGRMKEAGLEIGGVLREKDASTSFTDVMTLPSGERTFFHARGANSGFCREDVDVNALDCELFHLGYLLLLDALDEKDGNYGTKAARLLKDIRERGIKTSIDLVSDQTGRFAEVVAPALRYCDYAVMNEVEGGLLTSIEPRDGNGRPDVAALERICRKILETGVKEEIVIHCPEFSCAMDKKGKYTLVSSLVLPDGYIIGSVGAGDAFCSGMLYAFLNGMNAEEGMRLASCAAACNLSAADSVSGARDLAETMSLDKIFERRRILC